MELVPELQSHLDTLQHVFDQRQRGIQEIKKVEAEIKQANAALEEAEKGSGILDSDAKAFAKARTSLEERKAVVEFLESRLKALQNRVVEYEDQIVKDTQRLLDTNSQLRIKPLIAAWKAQLLGLVNGEEYQGKGLRRLLLEGWALADSLGSGDECQFVRQTVRAAIIPDPASTFVNLLRFPETAFDPKLRTSVYVAPWREDSTAVALYEQHIVVSHQIKKISDLFDKLTRDRREVRIQQKMREAVAR